VFGADSDSFDPRRTPRVPVKPARLAFGDGPHTCIGMALSIGETVERTDSEEATPVGLVTLTLRELFRAGVVPDEAQKSDLNVRDEYETYDVVFHGCRKVRESESTPFLN
jgi:hypothetical protein